jgi:uncharacterized protein involved in exopolysaccharide biosynthesis
MSRVRPSGMQTASEAPQPHRDVLPQEAEFAGRVSRGERLLVVFGLLAAGLCAVSAYFFSARQETVYGARAEILYQASDAERTLGTPRIMATQKLVLTSRTVLQPVAAEVGVPLDELQDATSVEIEGESDVMQLTVEDPNPRLALTLAEEIAQEYPRTVVAASSARVGESKRLLETRIAALQRRLSRVRARLRALERTRGSTLPPNSEQQELQAEAETLLERIGNFQDRLTELEVEQIGESQARARVITPAHVLEDPLRPKPIRAALAGLLVGLVLAAGFIALAAHARRRGFA